MKYSKFFLIIFICLTIVISAFPALADSPDEKTVIVIDAGHGGIDGGTDAGTKTEKEYNLALSLYLRDELLADGRFDVVMTRDDDTYLKYLARADIARLANADLLISVHCNQVPEDYVSGTQAFVSLIDRYNAADLAVSILESIESAVGMKRGKVLTRADSGDSLGIYYWNAEKQWDMPGAEEYGQVSDYFSMNTWSSKFGIPSIIVEHGYLSNKADLALLNDDASLKAIAHAEADAIIEYFTNHEHDYVFSVDYPSNCVFTGTASERCSICGKKINTTPLPPSDEDGHFWRVVSSEPATCTTDGYEHLICQISSNLSSKGFDCETHEKDVVIPALEHDYQTTDVSRGIRECTHCGDVRQSGCTGGGEHRFSLTETVEPTCLSDGRKTYRCSICGDEYSDVIHSDGHKYAVVDELPPDGKNDGSRVYRCSVCGDEYTESISSCTHAYATETVDPTCLSDGRITKICFICGHTDTTVLPATGHTLTDVSRNEPTCEEQGSTSGVCSVCGERVTESLEPLGHSFESDGLIERCSVCGKTRPRPIGEILSSNPILTACALIALGAVAAIVIIITQNSRARKKKKARRADLYSEWSTHK